MTVTDARHAAQDAPGSTNVRHMAYHSFTFTNDNTGDTANVYITEDHRRFTAHIESWPGSLDRTAAERYLMMASADLIIQKGESPTSYTQRIHEQAAILGMDTLRELSKPLLRDVPTAGEA